MKNNLFLMIIIAVIGIGGGFFAGMKYQQRKFPLRSGFQGARGARQPDNLPTGFPRQAANAVRGEIIAQDEKSITVKLADESSKIVLISENTQINKAETAAIADLTTGEQVMVFGTTNPDGSLSATQIQLNFEMNRVQE